MCLLSAVMVVHVEDTEPLCVPSFLSWRCSRGCLCSGIAVDAACDRALQLMLLVIGHCS